MKNELLKALYPVKRRLRRNRLLRGAAWGLAAGLGAALLLRLVALFIPLADRWLWAVLPVAMLTLLFAAGNALRPVTDRTAAEAADRCGLKERTITAPREISRPRAAGFGFADLRTVPFSFGDP